MSPCETRRLAQIKLRAPIREWPVREGEPVGCVTMLVRHAPNKCLMGSAEHFPSASPRGTRPSAVGIALEGT